MRAGCSALTLLSLLAGPAGTCADQQLWGQGSVSPLEGRPGPEMRLCRTGGSAAAPLLRFPPDPALPRDRAPQASPEQQQRNPERRGTAGSKMFIGMALATCSVQGGEKALLTRFECLLFCSLPPCEREAMIALMLHVGSVIAFYLLYLQFKQL